MDAATLADRINAALAAGHLLGIQRHNTAWLVLRVRADGRALVTRRGTYDGWWILDDEDWKSLQRQLDRLFW